MFGEIWEETASTYAQRIYFEKNWRFIFAFDSTVFWITSRASTFSAISRLSSRFSMAGVPFVSTLGSLMPDLVTAPASH